MNSATNRNAPLSFVVSAGMQKSGSTLLHDHCKALVRRQHGDAGQRAFEDWIRTGPVGGSGSFAWAPWVNHVPALCALAAQHGPFALKTHAPYPHVAAAVANEAIRTVFIHRDPRDAVLSALDHGARSRATGDWPYAECVDVATTLPLVRKWCADAVTWLGAPGVLSFQYEDLLADAQAEVSRLAVFLGVPDPGKAAATAIAQERADRQPGRNQFNKGAVCRWPQEMTAAQRDECERGLAPWIRALGYEIADG
jgi:hypothetical protein